MNFKVEALKYPLSSTNEYQFSDLTDDSFIFYWDHSELLEGDEPETREISREIRTTKPSSPHRFFFYNNAVTLLVVDGKTGIVTLTDLCSMKSKSILASKIGSGFTEIISICPLTSAIAISVLCNYDEASIIIIEPCFTKFTTHTMEHDNFGFTRDGNFFINNESKEEIKFDFYQRTPEFKLIETSTFGFTKGVTAEVFTPDYFVTYNAEAGDSTFVYITDLKTKETRKVDAGIVTKNVFHHDNYIVVSDSTSNYAVIRKTEKRKIEEVDQNPTE
jgi:hypothetical protein